MPTYNGAALVGETIASLQAQSFTDFELIVVDDCSTDDTPAVIEAFGDPRIRVIRVARQPPRRADAQRRLCRGARALYRRARS